jgi:hypothetical protein
MDFIMQTISKHRQELEKKIGRQLFDMEHKIDSRILELTHEVCKIRTENAAQTRCSRVEDELLQVKREFQVSILEHQFYKHLTIDRYIMYFVVQRFRCMVDASTQSTFTAAYVQVIIVVLDLANMNGFLINEQFFLVERRQC